MAVYEFRCRTCETRFEVSRPMAQAGAPATCPDGHADTVRLLSMFARTGASGTADFAPVAGGGACCGGACGCGHN